MTRVGADRAEAVTDGPDDPAPMTVEALVRSQLSRALGGGRGVLEGAVPTLGFTITWLTSRDLQLSLAVSIGLALVAMVIRLVQRSTVQFVMNAVVGIMIAALFALRTGNAEDVFLPGLIYNAVYATVLMGSVVVRWPLVGLMIGALAGDLVGWRRDRHLLALCTRLTLILAAPCVLRVVVQYPIWASEGDHTAALATAKLAMGWPLQLAALGLMVWLLSRDKTPVAIRPKG